MLNAVAPSQLRTLHSHSHCTHPLWIASEHFAQIKCNDKCTSSNWKGIFIINYSGSGGASTRHRAPGTGHRAPGTRHQVTIKSQRWQAITRHTVTTTTTRWRQTSLAARVKGLSCIGTSPPAAPASPTTFPHIIYSYSYTYCCCVVVAVVSAVKHTHLYDMNVIFATSQAPPAVDSTNGHSQHIHTSTLPSHRLPLKRCFIQ